jgi:hypothetical protein
VLARLNISARKPSARAGAQPWCQSKTEPAFEGMLTSLRRVMITTRISVGAQASPTPSKSSKSWQPGTQQPRSCEIPGIRQWQLPRMDEGSSSRAQGWSICGKSDQLCCGRRPSAIQLNADIGGH